MNKKELIDNISEKAGISKKDAAAALNAFTKTVEEAMVAGDKVQLVGFGTFEVRQRGERTARNPQTKEQITVPASKAPAFKASSVLKKLVNE